MEERTWPCMRWRIFPKRLIAQTLIFIVMLQLFPLLIIGAPPPGLTGPQLLQCYRSAKNRIPELEEFLVPKGRSFFFHETSCSTNIDRDFPVNARRACAVESAALHHPHNLVYLLISAPVTKTFNETNNKAIQALLEYSNIRIRHIRLRKYLQNTPMDNLIIKLLRSSHPMHHMSDILRYTTLYKFLGTYLDSDVIVLKPLDKFKNYAGLEYDTSVGAGLINFSEDSFGRTLAVACAEELSRTFNGQVWAHNGPGIITKMIRKMCKRNGLANKIDSDCEAFHALPIRKIYALPLRDSKLFFMHGLLSYIQSLLNDSIATHYWNSGSSKYELPKGDLTVPFLYYANIHCPAVYKATNGKF